MVQQQITVQRNPAYLLDETPTTGEIRRETNSATKERSVSEPRDSRGTVSHHT